MVGRFENILHAASTDSVIYNRSYQLPIPRIGAAAHQRSLGGRHSPDGAKIGELQKIQLRESDIISFHNYSWSEYFRREVAWLKKYNRPVICTEYMAHSVGSTFDTILPIAQEERVGAINWGFVAGKTQTYLPWEWEHPYVLKQPPVWFHDVLRPDGTPYREEEVDLIRQLARKPALQSR